MNEYQSEPSVQGPESEEGCNHPECKEVARRLETISKEQGYAAWEEALYVLGYCTPRHSDEADYGDMPADAERWIDPLTMPHTARRWREKQRSAREEARYQIEQEQLEEVRREMEMDRRYDAIQIDLWEKLTEQAKQRPLSQTEKQDLFYCEQNFGGRDKLIAYCDRPATRSR